jgi:hypothetical protein
MGEEHNKIAIDNKVTFRLELTPINVDHVTDCGEDVEAYTERQDNVDVHKGRMIAQPAGKRPQGIAKEQQVLEEAKYCEINRHADQHYPPAAGLIFGAVNPQSQRVIESSAEQQQCNKLYPPKAIKDETSNQNKPEPQPFREAPVQESHNRQKQKQVSHRVKQHVRP